MNGSGAVPDKLIGFTCYDNGNQMIGVADVSLPEISFMTESIKGAGISGEIDTPSIGNVQSMTTTINWRILYDSNIKFLAPKTYLFDFRGSTQTYNQNSGEFESTGLKIVMKCIPKKFSPGKFDVAAKMDTSGEFEILYLKISIEGKEVVEIDKLSYICKIDGVDYLAKARKDLGLN